MFGPCVRYTTNHTAVCKGINLPRRCKELSGDGPSAPMTYLRSRVLTTYWFLQLDAEVDSMASVQWKASFFPQLGLWCKRYLLLESLHPKNSQKAIEPFEEEDKKRSCRIVQSTLLIVRNEVNGPVERTSRTLMIPRGAISSGRALKLRTAPCVSLPWCNQLLYWHLRHKCIRLYIIIKDCTPWPFWSLIPLASILNSLHSWVSRSPYSTQI